MRGPSRSGMTDPPKWTDTTPRGRMSVARSDPATELYWAHETRGHARKSMPTSPNDSQFAQFTVREIVPGLFRRLRQGPFRALLTPEWCVHAGPLPSCGSAGESVETLERLCREVFVASNEGTRGDTTRSVESVGWIAEWLCAKAASKPLNWMGASELDGPLARHVLDDVAHRALQSGDSHDGVLTTCSCGESGCGMQLGVVRRGMIGLVCTFSSSRLRSVSLGPWAACQRG